MKIGPHKVGNGHPPLVVAEIGASHGGSLDVAKELIGVAKMVGADCVKLQAYEAQDVTIDCDRPDFRITAGPWKGRTFWDLYSKAQTPLAWFPELAAHAGKVGITWMASVFSKRTVDLCASLDMPAYKIASADIVNLPLIRYAASKGRPMIISTGMATYNEINDATEGLYGRFALLHCIAGYPSKPEEANLKKMADLMDDYSCPIGLSDHSHGIEVPVAATALGAVIIEKHLRIGTKSEDSEFSLWPNEFRMIAEAVRRTWAAMQPAEPKSEDASRQARRSLFAVRAIKKDDPFTEANVRAISPANGLPPKHLASVLQKKAARDIERGTPLAKDMLAC